MIDVESDDDETFEDKLFEKADHIGDIVTGKKKYTKDDIDRIKIYTQRLLNKDKRSGKIKPKNPPKPNPVSIFIKKYKSMPKSRLVGLIVIVIFALVTILAAGYLLFSIMMSLMNAGIFGIIGFGILAFGVCMSALLVFSLRFNRK